MADGSSEIQFSETSAPEQICAHCHECRPLYELSVAPAHKALVLSGGQGDTLIDELERGGYTVPDHLQNEIHVLMAKLSRVKRIAGLYAQAFHRIEQLGVAIPFPGVAAFAANVVHNELGRAIGGHLALNMDQMDYGRNWYEKIMHIFPGLGGLQSGPEWFVERVVSGLVRDITYGNLLVFVEVFPIYTFCIKHFERFGIPRGQEAIGEFDQCLQKFIEWWDKNNFGSGDDEFTIKNEQTGKEEQRIRIDRAGLFREGIIFGLRGDRLDSALSIMENEQRYTLQEYMYDRIDWGWPELFKGGFEIDDPFYGSFYVASLFFGPVALVFAEDLQRQDIEQKYKVPWTGGNVTEVDDRLVFTEAGVKRFDSLYYGSDRDYMRGEISKLRRHAHDT